MILDQKYDVHEIFPFFIIFPPFLVEITNFMDLSWVNKSFKKNENSQKLF